MILLELEIEDYKQFRGKHTFAPVTVGVVAIIGPNGAGKTTLFEAIEWCLYQPREIRSDEIPPRGLEPGRPRVRLRIANPVSGQTFEIERSLKRAGASAEIRLLGENGPEIVASGSSTVSAYNASQLIGLEHRAFVATFFTRQKELSFFGTLKPTERRREVGRLLGLETIRTAQELIAEERTAERNRFQALQNQYQHESGERDFGAERELFTTQLAGIDQVLAEFGAKLSHAEGAFRNATDARTRLAERRETILKLQADLGLQRTGAQAATLDIQNAEAELARIDQLAIERTALSVFADRLTAAEATVGKLEADRERFLRRQSAVEQLAAANLELNRLIARARSTISTSGADRAPHSISDTDPLTDLDAIVVSISLINATVTEERLAHLQSIMASQKEIASTEAELFKFQSGIAGLKEKLVELTRDSDPGRTTERIGQDRDEANRTIATYESNIASFQRSISDLLLFTERDSTNLTDPICPTCGRPIGVHDADDTREHAEQRIKELRTDITGLQSEIDHQRKLVVRFDEEITRITNRDAEIARTSERIANGETLVAETRTRLDILLIALAELRESALIPCVVTEQDIRDLQTQLQSERAAEQQVAALIQIRESVFAMQVQRKSHEQRIEEIGVVEFDPTALLAALSERDQSRTALTRISSIDQQLTRKSEFEATIRASRERLDQANAEITRLESELPEKPLDQGELDIADRAVEQAKQVEQQIRAQREAQRRNRLTIEQLLTQLDVDQNRLAAVADRAELARVAADDLDHMYREFNHFEQYVARRVRPQLEDMTSELVRVITEGKYDSIQLDDDYGIKVLDGDLGAFPIEHFSGGERDVIALSARLALSRLIGAQAANPPSFLVLDEVFGSLDRDRRSNVLELLGSLSSAAESFQQLFVISHIDDVRLSPVFNEVWRVVELADGTSSLENLNLTRGAEDL